MKAIIILILLAIILLYVYLIIEIVKEKDFNYFLIASLGLLLTISLIALTFFIF